MTSAPTNKLSCIDCRYYRHARCAWARENFAPAWVGEHKFVFAETGATCDCWENTNV